MLEKHSLLRLSAASVATMFFTMGVAAPVHADENGRHHKAPQTTQQSAKSEHASKAASHQHGTTRAGGDTARGTSTDQGRSKHSRGTANPPKHDPVTVCHLLGNGSYNILTFDDSALKAHTAHGDIYPVPAGGCPAAAEKGRDSVQGKRGATPPKHVRVTVCHVLGNGSYNILTFDDSALKAHTGHGDIYPVPADGCPVAAVGETPVAGQGPGVGDESQVTPGEVLTSPAVIVLQQVLAGTVLGVQAEGTANRAPAQVAPAQAALGQTAPVTVAPTGVAAVQAAATGALPQTGAGEVTLTVAGGLGLLAAGAAMLTRRRHHARR